MPSQIQDDQLAKQITKTQGDLDAIDARVRKYQAWIENSPNLKKELHARLNYLQVIKDARTPAPVAAVDGETPVLNVEPEAWAGEATEADIVEVPVGLQPRPIRDDPQA